MTAGCARKLGVALLLGLATGGLMLGGCRRPATPATPATTAPAVTVDTAPNAARSLLRALRAHLDASARHDRAAATAALERVELDIAAEDEIVARQAQALGRPVKDPGRLLQTVVENWAATIAYYTTFDFDHMLVEPGSGPKRQDVRVPAHGAHDDAIVRVACVQGDDGRWRVRALDFAAPTPPATRPAAAPSRPTSAP